MKYGFRLGNIDYLICVLFLYAIIFDLHQKLLFITFLRMADLGDDFDFCMSSVHHKVFLSRFDLFAV